MLIRRWTRATYRIRIRVLPLSPLLVPAYSTPVSSEEMPSPTTGPAVEGRLEGREYLVPDGLDHRSPKELRYFLEILEDSTDDLPTLIVPEGFNKPSATTHVGK